MTSTQTKSATNSPQDQDLPSPQPSTMRAMYAEEYGAPKDVLSVRDVPIPAVEKPDGVLVRVIAAGVHAGDWRLVRADPFLVRILFGGLRRPTVHVPGCDACGVVEVVGSAVTDFAVGDFVFGDLSEVGFGAFAEYVAVPESALVHKPDGVSAVHAVASGVSALAALQALRKVDAGCNLTGKHLLVNGASGGVGMFAIQFAKHFGARDITAVCHGRKAETVRAFGATTVVDYTIQSGFEEHEGDEAKKFDAVIDTACYDSPGKFARVTKPGGAVVVVGGSFPRFVEGMLIAPWVARRRKVAVHVLESKPNRDDLQELATLLANGAIKPHIDREYTLEQVPEALHYVEDRKVTGKVVVNVSQQ